MHELHELHELYELYELHELYELYHIFRGEAMHSSFDASLIIYQTMHLQLVIV